MCVSYQELHTFRGEVANGLSIIQGELERLQVQFQHQESQQDRVAQMQQIVAASNIANEGKLWMGKGG